MGESWDRYVAGYHDANPGITEDLLAGARDAAGRSPYDWVVDAAPAGTGPVVDLACGSGPLGRLLAGAGDRAGAGVVGVDRSAGELARASGPRVRASATALPLAGGCGGAVVCSLALMLLAPLDATLAEVARVLAPGGTFVATVPTRSAGTGAFTAILRDLGQVGLAYPAALDDADLANRFSSAGLRLVGDDVEVFTRTVAGGDDAALVVRGFYSPGAGPDRLAAAVATLERAAPCEVGYRLRRLVARRERPPAEELGRIVSMWST